MQMSPPACISPMQGVSSKPTEADTAQDLARGLKHELKTWEGAFQDKHGRAPEKSDLSLFPEISEKYRRYSKLKKVVGGGSGSKGATGHTDKERPQSENERHSNKRDNQAMFPLETSTLTMSLKRKTTTTRVCDTILSPPAPELEQPQRTDCRQLGERREQPVNQANSDPDDDVNATPKRQRTSMFFSVGSVSSSMGISARHGPFLTARQGDSDRGQEAASGLATSDAGSFNGDDWDMVAYVPPPSLIRRYTQQRASTTAGSAIHGHEPSPGTPRSVHSPLLSSFGVLSVSEQIISDNACDRADLGMTVPSFKARAGRLVKTTSIPLSTFGAQFRGASQILSSQGHLSDGECTFDASELVVDEPGDGEKEAGAAAPSAHKKKATQKRSTRRVKLKPVGKDGSVATAGRSGRGGSQQLVSNNFYKLKLKGGRRGPQSADERRTALYKRMVGKKSGGTAGSGPGSKGVQDRNELANDNNRGSLLGMDGVYECGEGGASDGADSSYGDEGSDRRAERKGKPATRPGRCSIAGQPLSFYAPDADSNPSDVCLLDMARSNTPSQDRGKEEAVAVDLRKVLARAWGFGEFKPGQVCAIKRVLEAQSTLLLLATGAGKSLAYQLPSLVLSSVYAGLTLVVTPLIALMRDQIRHLPDGLQALCMSFESGGKDSYSDAASRLSSGQIQLLFVSPERLQSPRFQELMGMEGMPPIQLAVVDEAHCASEWSHNFRPAYLQLPGLLQGLGARCVLAMTGTATAALADRLCEMFSIDSSKGVVRGDVVRDNIALSIVQVQLGSGRRSKSTAREDTLLGILKAPDMAGLESILVYVSTQASADRVAEYLTARSVPAQSYHAGKPAAERARIQAAFMRESPAAADPPAAARVPIRVLVATVAFGLGLNKSNIRAVVHFNLPRSMEAYVQEVGRAGRDGAPALGIMLLATSSAEGAAGPRSVDAVQIRSWAHSDGVDATAVRRLLHKLFPAPFVCSAIAAATRARAAQAHPTSADWQVANTAVLELKALESDIDADQAVIQTLISYLALKDSAMFEIEPNTHRKCDVRFTRTELGKLAETHSFFAKLADYANARSALTTKQQQQRGGPSSRFQAAKKTSMCAAVDIFEFATSMGLPASDVTAELYHWRAKREVMLEWLEPSCVVKVSLDLSRFITEPLESGAELSDEEWGDQLALRIDAHISSLAETICQQNEARVQDSLYKVNTVEALMLAALQVVDPPNPLGMSTFLQTAIKSYFAASQAECEQALSDLRTFSGGASENPEPDSAAIAYLSCQFQDAARPRASEAISPETRAQIHRFAQQHCAELKTGRAIARVFHGLSSPSCSSSQWMWCSEWGSLVWVDFDAVRQCAQEELVKLHFPVNGLASGDSF